MEFNQKIKLAELLGIILGDGNLHKKNNCITIVGSLEDFYYYTGHVIPLIKSLFDVNPKLRKRNDRNAYYIDFNSKDVMGFLSGDIGLVRGNKVNARMPNIIKDNCRLVPHFLRGLFDTDGCLKFSKQNRNKNYYPRVRLAFKESKFTENVGKILEGSNFNYGKWEDNRTKVIFYEISGKKSLIKWFDKIKPSNPVHISKYLFWKKFGYYIPKSSLDSRLNALTLNIEDISQ